MNESKKRRLKAFPHLRPEDFMHPWDRKATSTLQEIPGFQFLVSKVMEYGLERIFSLTNLSSNLRVTARMLPRLHQYLTYGCRILDMNLPELYVSTDPEPNAYTYGHNRPFIVLTSGMIELLDDEELFLVLAHELGHIKCGHVLYRTMASHMAQIMEHLGKATLGLGNLVDTGIQLAMFDWCRKSELSADRASLLCVQDIHVANRTLMKLAGGAKRLFPELDEREFLIQVRSYEDAGDESILNKAYTFLLSAQESHPFVVMRAKHLDLWVQSGQFAQVAGFELELEYDRPSGPAPTSGAQPRRATSLGQIGRRRRRVERRFP